MSTLLWWAHGLVLLAGACLLASGRPDHAALMLVLDVAGCLLYVLWAYAWSEKLDDPDRKTRVPDWERKLDDLGDFLGEFLPPLISLLFVLAFAGAATYFLLQP